MNKKINVTLELDANQLSRLQDFLLSLEKAAPNNTVSPVPVADAPAKAEPQVSQTDIRAVAARLVKSGKGEALSALFKDFGVAKLSDLPKEKYPEFLAALEEV